MTCPHGEPDPSCCLDCLDGPPPPRPAGARRPAAARSGSGYVVAQYDGWCPGCDEEVVVGEKIVEFEPGRWGHLACAAT